jgi:hypothetical protein
MLNIMLRLLDDILSSILSEWLTLSEVCNWDSASCNHKHRASVLRSISLQSNRFFITIENQADSLALLLWLVCKEVSQLSGSITINSRKLFKTITNQFDVSKMTTVLFKGSGKMSSLHVVGDFLPKFPNVRSLQLCNLNQCHLSEVGSQYVTNLVSINIVSCTFGDEILVFLSKHCVLLKTAYLRDLVSASMTSIKLLIHECTSLNDLQISVVSLPGQNLRGVYYEMTSVHKINVELIVSGAYSEHEEMEMVSFFSDAHGFREIKINLAEESESICTVCRGEALSKLITNNINLIALTLNHGIGKVDFTLLTTNLTILRHLKYLSIEQCESCLPIEFSKMIQSMPITLLSFRTNYSKLTTAMLIQALAFRAELNELSFNESDLICMKSLLRFTWTYCRDIMINDVNFGDGSAYLKIRNW